MSTAPSTTHAAKVLEVPRCALHVLSGAQRGAERTIDLDLFRIGKADTNDLVLTDDTVSRNHCEIVRDRRGYLLRDLGSTNGTLLDGSEIKEAWLKAGSVITVGKVELKVRPFNDRVELLPSEKGSFGEVVGSSLVMRQIFGLLERLGPTDATVLLGGETGTGKDVIARSIHNESPRRQKPFIVVDCGAVVGTLIESELFGHEKGAFTGATSARQGAFELAHGGTLFLDEIGELPLDLQPKLLRAIEQRQFRRVGGNRELRVDIRVIAASKRNLKMEVARGKFREDLYFRLAVVPIEVPPLRERLEDVPLLAERILADLSRLGDGRPTKPLTPDAIGVLRGHDWPGNVRELRNVLERAVYIARASGDANISGPRLPITAIGSAMTGVPQTFASDKSYRDTRAEWEASFEKSYVTWLLERHQGNVSAAARSADMDRKYLHKLARKHGIQRADFEEDDS